MNRVRITLDMSSRLGDNLERLSAVYGTSKAGALRKGLNLLEAADTAQKEGLQVGAWKDDDGIRREQVFLI